MLARARDRRKALAAEPVDLSAQCEQLSQPRTSRSRRPSGRPPQENAGTGTPPPHPAHGRCGRPAARPRSCTPWAAGRDRRRRPRWRPAARSVCANQTGVPAASTRTRLPASRASAGSSASRPATDTVLPSHARVASGSLAGSMNSSVPPSACVSANPRANGVNGTSPPRMFSSQAIEAGSLITAASCFASRSSPAICSRFSVALRPGILERMRTAPAQAAAPAGQSRPRRPGSGSPAAWRDRPRCSAPSPSSLISTGRSRSSRPRVRWRPARQAAGPR